jgi:hypothetical protein
MPARSHLTFANGILMERYMITAIAFLALTRVARPVTGSSTTLPTNLSARASFPT